MMLNLILLALGDYPGDWPRVELLDRGLPSQHVIICADPLASLPDLIRAGPGLPGLKAVGMISVLDQDLRPLAVMHGKEAGEQLGRTLILPRPVSEHWDFASVSQAEGMAVINIVHFSEDEGLTTLVSLPTTLPVDAHFLPIAFASDQGEGTFNLFATAGTAMYALRLNVQKAHLEVASVPTEPGIRGPISALTVTRCGESLVVRAWPSLTEQFDGATVVRPITVDAANGRPLPDSGTLTLASPPWRNRGAPSTRGANRAQILHVEQTEDEAAVVVRLGVARTDVCAEGQAKANRVELHLVAESHRLPDGFSFATRCIALGPEDCWESGGFRLTKGLTEPWDPFFMNWGRQVFDLRMVESKGPTSFLVVSGLTLEARQAELLSTERADFLLRAYVQLASSENLTVDGERSVWLGGGKLAILKSRPVIIFASRTRLAKWPGRLDWEGRRFEASAGADATAPSITVFDLVDWSFTQIGREL